MRNLKYFIHAFASYGRGLFAGLGFATTQDAYQEAVILLFEMLNLLEHRLVSSRYLLGRTITEADFRLLTTLLRFDPVYFGHFKCNVRRLVDYPNLWESTPDLYQIPGV